MNALSEERAAFEAAGRFWEERHVADLLGLAELTVQRMARRRAIPVVKVGRFWRFQPTAVRAWMEATEGYRSLIPVPRRPSRGRRKG